VLQQVPEVEDVVRRTGRAERTQDPMPHMVSDDPPSARSWPRDRPGTCPICSSAFTAAPPPSREPPAPEMGLWIVRGLLAAANGQVWAENCEDGGARFTLSAPAETQ
jgi:hypothetical protein